MFVLRDGATGARPAGEIATFRPDWRRSRAVILSHAGLLGPIQFTQAGLDRWSCGVRLERYTRMLE